MPCLGVLAVSPGTPAQSPCQTRPAEPFSCCSHPMLQERHRASTAQRPALSSQLPKTRREPAQPWCQCGGTHGLGFLLMLHCFSLENCSSSLSLPSSTKGIAHKPSIKVCVRTTATPLLFPSSPLLQHPNPQTQPKIVRAGANPTLRGFPTTG